MRAIELNGVAVAANQRAFLWGRRAAFDLAAVEKIASPAQPVTLHLPQSLDKIIQRRIGYLSTYQNAAYAKQYSDLVQHIRDAENKLILGVSSANKLTLAVAHSYFKLMAYKDEYEVARLYTDGQFVEKLKQQFEGDFQLKFNLAPPLFAKKDAQGHLLKAQYGSWMWSAFRVLAKGKALRGTRLDVFGYSAERRMERALIVEYRDMMRALLPNLHQLQLETVIALANLPQKIRGFGHVKEQAMHAYQLERAQLLAQCKIGNIEQLS
jgi:indolepyruvate ferredoxin oxidoreductase